MSGSTLSATRRWRDRIGEALGRAGAAAEASARSSQTLDAEFRDGPRGLRASRDRTRATGRSATSRERYGLEHEVPIAGRARKAESEPGRPSAKIVDCSPSATAPPPSSRTARLAGTPRRRSRARREASRSRRSTRSRTRAEGEDYFTLMRANLARTAQGPRMPLAVDLSGVAFAYDGANRVLADVDLKIDEGEFVAIAGPNGGGKTTLVRLVLGLERPDDRDGAPLRRARASLLPPRARSGISPSARGSGSRRRSRCARWCPPAGSRRAGCSGRCASASGRSSRRRSPTSGSPARRTGSSAKLSGGQQQRAFIAKALAGEPSLLVLDEPTAGVDADAQEALGGLLARAARRSARDDPLRLARVRRGRVGGRADRPRARRHRLRRAAEGSPRRAGTTPRTRMFEYEFMRLAFAAGAVVGAARAGGRVLPRAAADEPDRRRNRPHRLRGRRCRLPARDLPGRDRARLRRRRRDRRRVAALPPQDRGRPGPRAAPLHGARRRSRDGLRRREVQREPLHVPVRLDPHRHAAGRARHRAARRGRARRDRAALPRARRGRARRGGGAGRRSARDRR